MDAEPVYDVETLADLREVFGPERVASLLTGLGREIDERLVVAETEREQLGRNAHALVSVSGTLGFMPLSRACGALERACLGDADVSTALAEVKTAAAATKRAIGVLTAP